MAPLVVDPVVLDAGGSAVVSAGESLGSVISALTSALSGTAGMAGDDPAGAALGHSYDQSAGKLMAAMATARNGLCGLGDGVRMSAHNYSVAEALSDVSGHAAPLPVPPSTGSVAAGSAPPAVGKGSSAPAGWGWVAPYVGMIWPTGDSGRLRAAAAAWTAAGTSFAIGEILGSGAPMTSIRAQQLPEGAAIDAGFNDAFSATTGIVQQCQALAGQLSAYADKIDAVHAAITDLLARICDPLTGLKEVWEFLTDQDEDEIKKIADDIRTVVNNFTGEVDALCSQIAGVLTAAGTAVTAMAGWADQEWDQFLHGTDVGRAVNQLGQFGKGAGAEVGGILQMAYDYSPSRMVADPVGYFGTLLHTVEGEAPLVGLGGDGAPGVGESWRELGKDAVHWDEWSTNPAEAAGKSAVDLATLAAPGGPLSKLGKLGRGARDMVQGLKDSRLPESPRPPHPEPSSPPHTEPPKPTPPAGDKPALPADGRPAPAPPAKPTAAPPGSPAPHSPTETTPPAYAPAEKPTAAEPPKPPAESPAAPPHAPASPRPAGHLSPTHLQPPEPTPAAAPTLPGAHPPGPPAPANQPPHAAPLHASSPPHKPSAPVPHSPAGRPHPLEPAPPHEPGGPHPPEPPSLRDGALPGDPHRPRPPGDGSPGEHGHGHGDHHDHLTEPYTPTDVAVEAAQRTYERAAAAEPAISRGVVDAVGDAGGHLQRFESRLKDIDSLARKLDGKLKYVNPSDFQEIQAAENRIGDAVRYTAVVPADGYWGHGNAVIKGLEECGFTLKEDPGGWRVPDVYRGRNLTFQTPDGMKFEVQIHTGDSLSAAEQTHLLYAEKRLPTTSAERRAELEALLAEVFNSVPIPSGTPLLWKDP